MRKDPLIPISFPFVSFSNSVQVSYSKVENKAKEECLHEQNMHMQDAEEPGAATSRGFDASMLFTSAFQV